MSKTDDVFRSSYCHFRWTAVIPIIAIILACIWLAIRLANAQHHTEIKTRIVIKEVDCVFPDSRLQKLNDSWVGTIRDFQAEQQKLRERAKNTVPESCRKILTKGSKEANSCEEVIQNNIQKLSPIITDFNSRVTGFCNTVITAFSKSLEKVNSRTNMYTDPKYESLKNTYVPDVWLKPDTASFRECIELLPKPTFARRGKGRFPVCDSLEDSFYESMRIAVSDPSLNGSLRRKVGELLSRYYSAIENIPNRVFKESPGGTECALRSERVMQASDCFFSN